MDSQQPSEVIEHASTFPFDRTLERVVHAIENAGMTVFARIDHAANARLVGAAMPPATVLIYGNAKGGTPIMVETPRAALDLPLRVLIQERTGGRVVVAFHPIAVALGRVGVPESSAARLAPAQRILLDALVGGDALG